MKLVEQTTSVMISFLCTTAFHIPVTPVLRPRTSFSFPCSTRSRIQCAATAVVGPQDKVAEITDPYAVKACTAVEAAMLNLPAEFADGPASSSFIRTQPDIGPFWKSPPPPVLLLHGFDSSCLEYRRLLPALEAQGIEAYAIDLLGWGFTDTSTVKSVGVAAKRAHVYAFWEEVLKKRPMVLVGTSLGAATLIDFYAAHPEAVASVALLDPQGFIDGAPPVPRFAAKAGIAVLGSWPLRSVANQLAYYDTETLATEDAIRVGQLHCYRPGWEDDSIEWLLGGGYSVSSLVPRLADVPSLLLWGRQDEILPPAEYLPKFLEALPDISFRWVEKCGHSPHIEQPAVVAEAIKALVEGKEKELKGDSSTTDMPLATASSQSLLDRVNAFLDTPILDTGVRGGSLEPLKRFARDEPEIAQILASVVALSFFGFLSFGLLQLSHL